MGIEESEGLDGLKIEFRIYEIKKALTDHNNAPYCDMGINFSIHLYLINLILEGAWIICLLDLKK